MAKAVRSVLFHSPHLNLSHDLDPAHSELNPGLQHVMKLAPSQRHPQLVPLQCLIHLQLRDAFLNHQPKSFAISDFLNDHLKAQMVPIFHQFPVRLQARPRSPGAYRLLRSVLQLAQTSVPRVDANLPQGGVALLRKECDDQIVIRVHLGFGLRLFRLGSIALLVRRPLLRSLRADSWVCGHVCLWALQN